MPDPDIRPYQIQDLDTRPDQIPDPDIRPDQIQDLDTRPDQMPDPDIRPDQIQDLDTRPDQIPNTYVQDGSPTLGKANKGQTENGQNDAFWLKFRLGSENFWAEYRGKDRLGARGGVITLFILHKI